MLRSKGRIPRHRHRHPREDPREDIARVRRVGVMECGLNALYLGTVHSC